MTDSHLRELERRFKETGSVEDEAAYLLERVRAGDLEQSRLELAAVFGHEGSRAVVGDEVVLYDYRRLRAASLDDETLARLAHASCLAALTDDRYSPAIQTDLRANADACERFIESGVRIPPDHYGFFAAVPSTNQAFGCLQSAHDSLGFEGGYEEVGAQLVPWLLGNTDPVRNHMRERAAQTTRKLEALATPRLLALLKKTQSCEDCVADWRARCEHPSKEQIKRALANRGHVGRG